MLRRLRPSSISSLNHPKHRNMMQELRQVPSPSRPSSSLALAFRSCSALCFIQNMMEINCSTIWYRFHEISTWSKDPITSVCFSVEETIRSHLFSDISTTCHHRYTPLQMSEASLLALAFRSCPAFYFIQKCPRPHHSLSRSDRVPHFASFKNVRGLLTRYKDNMIRRLRPSSISSLNPSDLASACS